MVLSTNTLLIAYRYPYCGAGIAEVLISNHHLYHILIWGAGLAGGGGGGGGGVAS